jgi:hypothetical protein
MMAVIPAISAPITRVRAFFFKRLSRTSSFLFELCPPSDKFGLPFICALQLGQLFYKGCPHADKSEWSCWKA